MSDIGLEEEDENLDDQNNLNEMGLMPDSEVHHNDTVNVIGFGLAKNIPRDLKGLNQTINAHNKIKEELDKDSENEIDENNDADPEELDAYDPNDANRTIDDVWTMHIFGKRDPKEKYVPFESKNAKFFERVLHPIQYGSMRGSIFGLSSMCLEAGSMVLAILGNKMGVFMDVNIAIYLFGALISFQVIIYQLIGAVIFDIKKIMGNNDDGYADVKDYLEKYWTTKYYLKFPIMFGVAALVFPLCLLKDITKMRIPSLIGVLALVYSIIVVIVESFFYLINENLPNNEIKMNWIDIRDAFSYKDGIPFFGGIATVFYLYSCHAGAFPVYKNLRNNTTRRIKKVFRRSILLDIVIYFCIAGASFLTAPENPPDLILYRKNLSGFDPDYFILIAKIGVIFNLFFSTPANYAGFRLSFFELVWGNANITNKKNFIVTLVVFSVIVTIGALYDKILDYIELLGGFCSVIYCILIPGLIYVKSENIKKSKIVKYLTLFIIFLLLIIGYTSGILTILFNMAGLNK